MTCRPVVERLRLKRNIVLGEYGATASAKLTFHPDQISKADHADAVTSIPLVQKSRQASSIHRYLRVD
jgi:hypothetical protein